jgi:hypothetical protein
VRRILSPGDALLLGTDLEKPLPHPVPAAAARFAVHNNASNRAPIIAEIRKRIVPPED